MANSLNADIDAQINILTKDIRKFASDYDLKITQKALLKRAGKVVLKKMKELAPKGDMPDQRRQDPKPGNLKKKIQWLPLTRSKDVFVGPRGVKYAHLIEYGFVHYKSKKLINAQPFVFRAYEATKAEVLKNLQDEAKREFDKLGVIYDKN